MVWMLFTAIVYTIAYFATDQVHTEYLSHAGIRTSGKVIAKQPDNHRTIVYRYNVDGVDYTGVGSAGRGNPDFDSLKLGDEIQVTFDPENRLLSIPGDPNPLAQANGDLIFKVTAFCAVLIGVIIFVPYFLYRRAKRVE